MKLVGHFILWHRYIGIVFSLFFLIWFASGVVMIYARMPETTDADRLARLPPLDFSKAHLSPAEAFAKTGISARLLRATVAMTGNRPAYHFLPQSGNWVTVYADDGSILRHLEPSLAIDIAARFDGISPEKMRPIAELQDVDQWTVNPSSRPYLPFQRIGVDDAQRTEYYVSEATGEVFLRDTRRARLLAWFGAIPHWWYIRALRANTSLWRWVLIVASLWGIAMCTAGILAGVLRFSPSRRYRFPGPRRSFLPYARWKRWHSILGGVFGFFTFTWILSGLFTLNPGNWSSGPDPSQAEAQAFAGSDLSPGAFRVPPAEATRLLGDCIRPAELEMIVFQDQPYYLAKDKESQFRLLSAGGQSAECIQDMPVPKLLEAGRRAADNAPLVDWAWLTGFDAYYYSDLTYTRPLPVVRLRFADARHTWLYVNPRTALIEASYKDRTRQERWLYEGLHDLDYPLLYRHRLLWQATLFCLLLGGLALSFMGVVLGEQYIQKRAKRWLKPHLTS